MATQIPKMGPLATPFIYCLVWGWKQLFMIHPWVSFQCGHNFIFAISAFSFHFPCHCQIKKPSIFPVLLTNEKMFHIHQILSCCAKAFFLYLDPNAANTNSNSSGSNIETADIVVAPPIILIWYAKHVSHQSPYNIVQVNIPKTVLLFKLVFV